MSSYDPMGDPRRQIEQAQRWLRHQGKGLVGGAVAVLLVAMAWTSYYQVEPEEVGLVLRFGKHIGNTQPGLQFKIPFGVDEVIKVPVARQLKMEFGFRTVSAGVQSEFARGSQATEEAKMLTADRNVAVVEWIVQYTITSPEKFIFNFRDVNMTLRLMAEASMRAAVGDFTVDELITGGREQVEQRAREWMEALNARYDTGITIQQLKLQDANVADSVKPALREVEEAKQEMAKSINVAEAERNKVIPEAKGRAKESIAASEGYRYERVNEALGDAERFVRLHSEYAKAKEVTRTRLYLETLSAVLPKSKHKIVVDKNTRNLLPLLNLSSGSTP